MFILAALHVLTSILGYTDAYSLNILQDFRFFLFLLLVWFLFSWAFS